MNYYGSYSVKARLSEVIDRPCGERGTIPEQVRKGYYAIFDHDACQQILKLMEDASKLVDKNCNCPRESPCAFCAVKYDLAAMEEEW